MQRSDYDHLPSWNRCTRMSPSRKTSIFSRAAIPTATKTRPFSHESSMMRSGYGRGTKKQYVFDIIGLGVPRCYWPKMIYLIERSIFFLAFTVFANLAFPNFDNFRPWRLLSMVRTTGPLRAPECTDPGQRVGSRSEIQPYRP